MHTGWRLACAVLTATLAACLNAGTGAASGGGSDLDAREITRLVNDVRLRGCANQRPAAKPLQRDDDLDDVAARLARGGTLAAAVQAQRYPAQRSASIAVQPPASSTSLVGLLQSERYCRLVADSAFVRIGIASGKRGAATLVLAAPFAPPAMDDPRDVARRALALVNAARSEPQTCGARSFASAPPLRLDTILGSVAAEHARDMASNGRMSHEGSDGSEPQERMTRAGYPWRLVAENVAAGQTTADEVVATWLASPGHCVNIMNPDLREMGIAFAFVASSPDGTYWAQTFGTRR